MKYFLSFVEELSCNRDYDGWTFGRIEVYGQPEEGEPDDSNGYADEEIRWATPKADDFADFRMALDFSAISDVEALAALRTYMAKHWQVSLDDMQKFIKEKIDE